MLKRRESRGCGLRRKGGQPHAPASNPLPRRWPLSELLRRRIRAHDRNSGCACFSVQLVFGICLPSGLLIGTQAFDYGAAAAPPLAACSAAAGCLQRHRWLLAAQPLAAAAAAVPCPALALPALAHALFMALLLPPSLAAPLLLNRPPRPTDRDVDVLRREVAAVVAQRLPPGSWDLQESIDSEAAFAGGGKRLLALYLT